MQGRAGPRMLAKILVLKLPFSTTVHVAVPDPVVAGFPAVQLHRLAGLDAAALIS